LILIHFLGDDLAKKGFSWHSGRKYINDNFFAVGQKAQTSILYGGFPNSFFSSMDKI